MGTDILHSFPDLPRSSLCLGAASITYRTIFHGGVGLGGILCPVRFQHRSLYPKNTSAMPICGDPCHQSLWGTRSLLTKSDPYRSETEQRVGCGATRKDGCLFLSFHI